MVDVATVTMRRLLAAAAARRALETADAAPPADPVPIPGVRFPIGARVLELAGGTRGRVLAVERDTATSAELYAVARADGTTVYRSRDELAADASPAAPAPR